MNKFKTFNEEEISKLSPLISMIQELLLEKSLFEMKRQDNLNITTLGNVGFFFRYEDDQTYLCYTKHPKEWDELRIKYDMEEYKKYMLIKKGAQIEI